MPYRAPATCCTDQDLRSRYRITCNGMYWCLVWTRSGMLSLSMCSPLKVDHSGLSTKNHCWKKVISTTSDKEGWLTLLRAMMAITTVSWNHYTRNLQGKSYLRNPSYLNLLRPPIVHPICRALIRRMHSKILPLEL